MNCGRRLDAVTRPDPWVEKFFSKKNSRIFVRRRFDLVASDASFVPIWPHKRL